MPSIPKSLMQKEKESRMREKRSLNFDIQVSKTSVEAGD